MRLDRLILKEAIDIRSLIGQRYRFEGYPHGGTFEIVDVMNQSPAPEWWVYMLARHTERGFHIILRGEVVEGFGGRCVIEPNSVNMGHPDMHRSATDVWRLWKQNGRTSEVQDWSMERGMVQESMETPEDPFGLVGKEFMKAENGRGLYYYRVLETCLATSWTCEYALCLLEVHMRGNPSYQTNRIGAFKLSPGFGDRRVPETDWIYLAHQGSQALEQWRFFAAAAAKNPEGCTIPNQFFWDNQPVLPAKYDEWIKG